MQVSDYARTLIKQFNLSKEDFCKIVDIPLKRYSSYLNGGTNKEFLDIAKMQSAKMNLLMEKTAKEINSELKFEAQ